MNNLSITCPVSGERTDENVARATAAIILLIAAASLIFHSVGLSMLLAVDFALRAFSLSAYSPVRAVARRAAGFLHLEPRMTDAAPKKFAAGIGMLFSLAIGVFEFLHLFPAGLIAGIVLITCAGLESALNLCVGCLVYSLTVARWHREDVRERSKHNKWSAFERL